MVSTFSINAASNWRRRVFRGLMVLEIIAWTAVSALLYLGSLSAASSDGYVRWSLSLLYTKEFVVSFTAVAFPLFYLLVYGHSPMLGLLSLNIRRHSFYGGVWDPDSLSHHNGYEVEIGIHDQLNANLERTREEFRESYRRARLLIGVAVILAALGPLSIFTWEYAVESNPGISMSHEGGVDFWYFVPRISMFIFLEAVAGFFMSQYRRAMEQHRHYEAVLREREAQLVAYLVLSDDRTGNPEALRNFAQILCYLEMIDSSSPGHGGDVSNEPLGHVTRYVEWLVDKNMPGVSGVGRKSQTDK
jgi:hypothetical protein